ncbi:hypothetical protein [Paenibacillus apiarius]|uniref:Glycosyltransferase RgtA/B/C/D-like domain-containing protein n=1 Tax=Paenibacillus apiarius TaxID=46240 RepID=A0ABT4DZ38_9BACL|nr:hypothetical protein [Paenibacillus apiarius]MCY9513104.1 hypothetical protein [Paenibacillus apiarius]MCY9521538.1 hypothetical protein [Paenibacillus apiarius]MCY9551692.1 hypothetical protein [Paenibacillus apiarius]MCY9560520.1 hypothetical protein [Paenibacillus apiarius]MCY9685230.1 hypothetical protein [Paenibacillus apiarius]
MPEVSMPYYKREPSAATAEEHKSRALYWAIFAIVWLAEFIAGYYVSHKIGYMHSDAISRVANAFYVLYSGDPHLGAIGFIWNPLPSLVEIIFLVFYPIFPALASSGLAGVLMSSLFAGFTASLLVRAGDYHGISRWISVGISLLFALNPFMFLFGMNGLSDAPFIFFTMHAVIHLTYWMKDRHVGNLLKVSLSLALAFWTRYEAVPFAVGLGAAVVLALLYRLKKNKEEKQTPAKDKYQQAESALTLVWSPIVYSGLLWVFLNYIIMGNPFYFLNSEYSNVEQSAVLATDIKFQHLIGHPWNSFVFVLGKMLYFSIPLFGVALLRIVNRRWRMWELVGLLCMVSSIVALQYLLVVKGTSFGWFRYFMYVFPITVAWLPYELSKVRKSWLNSSIILVSLVLSVVVLTGALFDPEVAPDENKMLHAYEHAEEMEVDRQVARYLDSELQRDIILMDSYSAYYVILSSEQPSRFIITSDSNFRESLEDPRASGVDYILSPKPDSSSALSADNRLYPQFYERGAEWCELYKEFGDEDGGRWRIYKVKKKADVIEHES